MDEKSSTGSGVLFSRRKYLKTASALGISAIGVQSVHAKGDRTEVVVTRDSDGPVGTRIVPTEWYNQTQKARRKSNELKEQLLNHPDVASIGIGTGDSTIGGLKEKVIELSLEGDSTSANIPEHVDGTNVEVKTNASTEFQSCYEKTYDPLRGGISVSSDYESGSACCRVYKGGTPYLLTALHVFTDTTGPCGNTGDGNAYQGINFIGNIAGSRTNHDSVWININDQVSLNDGIVDESANVKGWVTQSGLDTYSSDGTTLHKRGVTTCKDTYTVDSYDNSISLSCGNQTEVVYYNGNAEKGDSGGIIYFISDAGNAFVSGLLSGTRTVDCGYFCSNDVVFGSAAYAMNNQYDLNFD